jgi:hypothetical protein
MARITEADVMRFRRRHERLAQPTIRKALQESAAKYWAMSETIGVSQAAKLLNLLLTPEPIDKALRGVISRTAKIAARNVDVRLRKSDFDVWWDQELIEYLDRTMFDKVVGIRETSERIILGFVRAYNEQIITGSIDPEKLQRELRKEWDGLTKMRALRIARTEVASAANFGSLASAKRSEVVETKTWNCVFKRSRDQHMEMHGTTIPKDELFKMPNGNEMDSPLDMVGGSAENVVNCQCYLTFD